MKHSFKKPEEVEVPDYAEHIWEWFWELRQTAFVPGFGQMAISFTELQAWAKLLEINIEPKIVSIIRAMDAAYLAAISEVQKKNQPKR